MPDLGDFGVVATYGNRLDRTIGRLIRWDTASPVNHAFVYVGGDQIVEAQPGGAVVSASNEYDDIIWSTGHIPLTDSQRSAIAADAWLDVGIGYSWLDIAAIAFVQARWHRGKFNAGGPLARAAERRISRLNRLICSQLVDLAYERAGVHLFTDGRPSGLVSPGDLYSRING